MINTNSNNAQNNNDINSILNTIAQATASNTNAITSITNYIKNQDKQNESSLALQTDLSSSVQLMGARLLANENQVKEIFRVLDEYGTGIKMLKDEFEIHKENEVIDENQRKNIRARTFLRIKEFLKNDLEYAKYHMTYFGDLYGYLKQYCHYTTMSSTKTKHYDDVMSGISSWYPQESKLKQKADDAAIARLVAKSQGYAC